MRKVIANTTPLIALSNIGLLDLLKKIYDEIIIPDAVKEEIKSEPAKTLIEKSNWIKTLSVEDNSRKKIFSSRLHAGEVDVLLLADEQKADLLIIDDNAAKKTAKFLGFKVTGTLGVLIKAKKEGFIDEVKPAIKALLSDGLFISEEIVNLALKEAGEM